MALETGTVVASGVGLTAKGQEVNVRVVEGSVSCSG